MASLFPFPLCGVSIAVSVSVSSLTQGLAAPLVRSQLVTLHTPALEPPLGIGAALAAVALLRTLIHIWKRKKEM